jgi:hypothetical protein
MAAESLLVGLIVAVCALASIWWLMPIRLRLKTLEVLAALPAGTGGTWVAKLRRRTLATLAGGCGACRSATRTLNASVRPVNRKSGAPRH